METASDRDRRRRFAQVKLSTTGNEDPILLVTDADGHMRYRLAEGEYQLSLVGGEHMPVSVHDQRWTTVRIHLREPLARCTTAVPCDLRSAPGWIRPILRL